MSFSFGTPSSAPATTGLGGGFNFGAAKPATPGFGLTATSQASTGLFPPATSAPAFGSAVPAFGATNTPSFGATSAAPSFGATATPGFGATSAAPSFGGTATPGFGSLPTFGATSSFGATSTASTFGAATTTPAFGATSTPAFGTSTLGFGTTGLGSGGLNFGAGTNTSTAATGLNFGGPAASTANTGLGGLGGIGFGSTTQSSGLGLVSSTGTTTSSSLFGGKLGTTNATNTLLPTSATPSLGLGGAVPTSGIGVGNAADAKAEPPKQQKLPNELSTTIDTFNEFVKKQKSLSSEVMRVSVKPLHKVARDAEETLRLALSLSGEVSRARAHSRRLRGSAAAALAAAETLARDSTARGLELEGTAPPTYVKELISELEQQLFTFRRQMEVADKQMQSSPKLLTEQELTLGIRRIYESLVALAGRLQAVHTQVEEQKEQYLNLRKYILKDPTDVFDDITPSTGLDLLLKEVDNSHKKIKTGNVSDYSLGSAVLSDPKAALGNIQHLAGPSPFTYFGSTMSPFPAADSSGPGWQPAPAPAVQQPVAPLATDSGTFQLQKPPGKRGKQ